MGERLAIEGGRPVREGAPIPLARPTYGYEELREIISVFEKGYFCEIYEKAVMVKGFEGEFAKHLGVKHAIAFNAGTTAQHASLAAAEIGPGDEVIVPALTFISTAYTVLLQNAIPIFADVELDTFNIDPEEIRRKITDRTRAIVPVHWFGHPAEMDEIMGIAEEHGLWIIEDCAHALEAEYKGRRAGTMGNMACWSLQETKILTSCGEGGVLTTDDDDLAMKARMIKDHGKFKGKPEGVGEIFYPGYRVVRLGNAYRMTEMQGAFALAQLRRLGDILEKRGKNLQYLDAHLKGLDGIIRQGVRDYVKPTPAYYPVRFASERFKKPIEEISVALSAEGILNYTIGKDELPYLHPLFMEKVGYGRTHCPYDCHYYKGEVNYRRGLCPNAERIAEELIILPLHAELSQQDLDDIVAAVEKVVNAYRE